MDAVGKINKRKFNAFFRVKLSCTSPSQCFLFYFLRQFRHQRWRWSTTTTTTIRLHYSIKPRPSWKNKATLSTTRQLATEILSPPRLALISWHIFFFFKTIKFLYAKMSRTRTRCDTFCKTCPHVAPRFCYCFCFSNLYIFQDGGRMSVYSCESSKK